MKRSKLFRSAGALATLALAGTFFSLTRHREPAVNPATSASRSQRPASAIASTFVDSRTESAAVGQSTSRSIADVGHRSPERNPIHLRGGKVLARVNDEPIQLSDLVPVTGKDAEQRMTPEEYESRLNRAIEMELTFQSAAAQQVQLNPDQMRRLTRIADQRAADSRELARQGLIWTSATDAQMDFERRVMAALMLQQNLVAKESNIAPGPDAARQRAYENALQTMLSRLKANANIVSTSGSGL